MSRVLIIIPARFASQRFPGKPLAALKGASGQPKSLIERSWRAAKAVNGVEEVIVATDDERIKAHAEAFGAATAMTSQNPRNGTERCAELLQTLPAPFDIVVNFQGDAPLCPAWFVEALISHLEKDPDAAAATPVLRCSSQMHADLIADRKAGRVGATTAIFNQKGYGLYFSKEVIPFTSENFATNTPTPIFHHVGIYAYRPGALAQYNALPVGRYEELEGLEQLRFVENGLLVACVEVDAKGHPFWELNNPEDIPKIEAILRAENID